MSSRNDQRAAREELRKLTSQKSYATAARAQLPRAAAGTEKPTTSSKSRPQIRMPWSKPIASNDAPLDEPSSERSTTSIATSFAQISVPSRTTLLLPHRHSTSSSQTSQSQTGRLPKKIANGEPEPQRKLPQPLRTTPRTRRPQTTPTPAASRRPAKPSTATTATWRSGRRRAAIAKTSKTKMTTQRPARLGPRSSTTATMCSTPTST